MRFLNFQNITVLRRSRYSLAAFFLFINFCVFLMNTGNLFAVGLYSSSFNAPSGSIDGMTLALGGYPLDIAMNPANLTVSETKKFEVGGSVPYMHIRYQDAYNDPDPALAYTNNINIKQAVFLPHMGLIVPLTKKLSYGAALYTLGGAGIELNGIKRNTPTGTTLNNWAGTSLPITGDMKQITENITTRFFILKLTNGLAYNFGRLSVGAGLEINYAEHYTLYEYRDITGSFRIPGKGFEYKSDRAFSPGGIFGLTFRASEHVKIAYSYQTISHLPLNGRTRFDLDRPDQFYRQSNVSYIFKLPERHNIGMAITRNSWTWVLDASYLKFASTNSSINQILEYPLLDTPIGPTNQMISHVNAKDVYMVGGGAQYKPAKIAYRGGYSYSSLMLGEDGSAPMFAGTLHQHIVFMGSGVDMGDYELNFGYNHLFGKTLKGNDMSDWDLSHAMYPIQSPADVILKNIRMPFFTHSTYFSVDAFLFGVTLKY